MLNIKTKEFVAWLKTKPAEERYNYTDITNCCVSQFVKETMNIPPGHKEGQFHCGPFKIIIKGAADNADNYPIPDSIGNAVLVSESHTFGDVLKILEANKNYTY